MKQSDHGITDATVLWRCDKTGEEILVSDVLSDKISIERVAHVMKRLNCDPDRVLQNLVAQAMLTGYLPAMKLYAKTGDPLVLDQAIAERRALDSFVADIKKEVQDNDDL